jgi:hypothetical protein
MPISDRRDSHDCDASPDGTASTYAAALPQSFATPIRRQDSRIIWNGEQRGKIRTAFGILVGFAGLVAVFPRARAQMIVPVDRRLHPPQEFHLSGQWNCGAGASIAYIEVGNQNRATGGATRKTLVLTSSNGTDQLAPPHRIQYVVNDSHQFTVTSEMLEGTDWKAEPSFMCIKVEHDRRRSITLPGR